MPDPLDPAEVASADPGPSVIAPVMARVPTPDRVVRLLAVLPPGPARDVARAAAERLWAALAARWARDRRRLALAARRQDAERGAVHIFRMIDSGWRFADEPEALRALRRTLMPDGVGVGLYRDWSGVLAWMRAVADALDGSGAATARTRHLEWMVQRFVEEVEAAREASLIVPDDDPIAAAHALAVALEDAVTAWIEAGGDAERLVALASDASGEGARSGYPGDGVVEPPAGAALVADGPPAEVEGADD